MDEPTYTSSEFHNDVQKQIVEVAVATLADTKMSWEQIAPFLDAGRALCRDDIRLNGRLAMHGMEYSGAELVPADEAFLTLSVRDRDDGVEWLGQSWWLSDVALAGEDPDRVRACIAATERSLDKMRSWLDANSVMAANEVGSPVAQGGPDRPAPET